MQPVMIHRALMGSLERFFGVLIEHYGGAFPLWLAPVQLKILPITNEQIEYAHKIKDEFKDYRVEVDSRSEKLNYKIRESQLEKVPFIIIIGEKEQNSQTVSVRKYGENTTQTYEIKRFLEVIETLNTNGSNNHS